MSTGRTALLWADSKDTARRMINHFDLRPWTLVNVARGFSWDRKLHRDPNSRILYLVILTADELTLLNKSMGRRESDLEQALRAYLRDADQSPYRVYFDRDTKFDQEFDLVAFGTKDILWKIKDRHASHDWDKSYFRTRNTPLHETFYNVKKDT